MKKFQTYKTCNVPSIWTFVEVVITPKYSYVHLFKLENSLRNEVNEMAKNILFWFKSAAINY